MENRWCLNNKKTYELPDKDILMKTYIRKYTTPDFEPDLCVVKWGRNLGEECVKGSHLKELWIKTDNEELIKFIRSYNFRKVRGNAPNYELTANDVKKIILEEFYGVKNGE